MLLFQNYNLELYKHDVDNYDIYYFSVQKKCKYKKYKKLGNAINYIQKNEDLTLEETLQLIKLKYDYR